MYWTVRVGLGPFDLVRSLPCHHGRGCGDHLNHLQLQKRTICRSVFHRSFPRPTTQPEDKAPSSRSVSGLGASPGVSSAWGTTWFWLFFCFCARHISQLFLHHRLVGHTAGKEVPRIPAVGVANFLYFVDMCSHVAASLHGHFSNSTKTYRENRKTLRTQTLPTKKMDKWLLQSFRKSCGRHCDQQVQSGEKAQDGTLAFVCGYTVGKGCWLKTNVWLESLKGWQAVCKGKIIFLASSPPSSWGSICSMLEFRLVPTTCYHDYLLYRNCDG